ncbi:cation:proton antiporter [bacterium]|nr:cation:proton antiporter [bacterium]
MHFLSEQNIYIFLVQIFVLLALARGLGELFRKWKQPAFTAEILVGIILGPTILGRFLPGLYNAIFPDNIIQQNMLETIAWLGLLFFLLNIGLEVDFSSAWRQRGDALKIALTDIIVPISISFAACMFLPEHYLIDPNQRIAFALFMATAMTISAMPIAARALHDLKLSKTDLGFLIVSALSVNDIIGWLVFTLVLGFFTQTSLDIPRILVIMASTFAFTVVCLTVGRNLIDWVISKIEKMQLPQPATTLTFVSLLGLLCGAITQKIGIHALFGFFIAGIMAGEAKALSERTRQVISQMVYAIFIPLFFAGIGLKIDVLRNFDIFLVLFVSIISMFGKFLGAWIGVKFTKLSRANRLTVAICHVPGGSMEIVVGLLAYEYDLISEPVFVAIVFGAIASSVLLGPILSFSNKRRKARSILEFFMRRGIEAELEANSRDDAIRELSRIAAEQEEIPDPSGISNPVLKRENAMGTAIEEGIALPHARLSLLKRPIIIFGRSSSGIEWNSPDGKPTKYIFLVLTPSDDDDIQLQIFSIIAKVMSIPENRDRIIKADDSIEIWTAFQNMFTSSQIIRKNM